MRDDQGFSLIEVLVATTVFVVALASLAELFTLAIRSNLASRTVTDATVLAQQKVEELRALSWGLSLEGLPVADTTFDTASDQPTGGTGLSPSPPLALAENTAGFVDYVDRLGVKLGGGSQAPAGAIYTRRWAIEPLLASADTLVIQVRVLRNAVAGTARLPEEARITTVKTRKPL
jgi:prepilin-type N-terminal cleavage/methylation domain-containing protein